MKMNHKKLIPCLLCALILASALASCGDSTDKTSQSTDRSPTSDVTETTPQTSGGSSSAQNTTQKEEVTHDINEDTYKEQISYYMELAESLQTQLLKLKEESYVDECEYQLKIAALEDTIDMLKKTVASLTGGGSTEAGTQSGTQEPSNDHLSAGADYEYVTKNGQVTITKYKGNAIDVSIPSAIGGSPVTAIGEDAFRGLQIRSVTIPSGVKEIGWFAFSGCTVLESVSIPSSVTQVGYGAFDYYPKALKIVCEKGSYIEAYANSWGMQVSAQ